MLGRFVCIVWSSFVLLIFKRGRFIPSVAFSGQAAWSQEFRLPPLVLDFIFVFLARRVQQSHCSSYPYSSATSLVYQWQREDKQQQSEPLVTAVSASTAGTAITAVAAVTAVTAITAITAVTAVTATTAVTAKRYGNSVIALCLDLLGSEYMAQARQHDLRRSSSAHHVPMNPLPPVKPLVLVAESTLLLISLP